MTRLTSAQIDEKMKYIWPTEQLAYTDMMTRTAVKECLEDQVKNYVDDENVRNVLLDIIKYGRFL